MRHKGEHGEFAWVKPASSSGEADPVRLLPQGQDLAAAIDRLERSGRGLFEQSEKHVAKPVCTREQQQRPASLGNRAEQQTSAAHTCTCSHRHTLVQAGAHIWTTARSHLQCHISAKIGCTHRVQLVLENSTPHDSYLDLYFPCIFRKERMDIIYHRIKCYMV